MLTTIIVTSLKFEGSLVYKYDTLGMLRAFENKAELDKDQIVWFSTHFPMKTEMFLYLKENSKFLKFEELPADMTFNAFWEAYGYKKGNKYEAQKLWDGDKTTVNSRPVTEADRIAIFGMLSKMKYDYNLRRKELPYPSTFLNQRRWENEY